MMKLHNQIPNWILGLAIAGTMASCSQNNSLDISIPDNPSEENALHSVRMILQGHKGTFSDTRTAAEWQDGDKVYIQFSVGTEKVQGTATYQASTEEWNVQYRDDISKGELSQCEVYFFEDAVATEAAQITLDCHSAVYADKHATYILKDGVLRVTASLDPLLGRFRFKGTADARFILSGFKHFTKYGIADNAFEDKAVYTVETIGSDGYSPYFYGYFEDEANKALTIIDDDNWLQFDKAMPGNALQQGHSGVLKLPTEEHKNGWAVKGISAITYQVKGVDFKMIRVEGGTFVMGATWEQYGGFQTPAADELPTHNVTLSSYSLGETEVTQALWFAVMNYKPGTNKNHQWTSEQGLGDDYPAYFVFYDECLTFISKLSQLTGKSFRLPTEAEWEYAARGGNASKNFIYSGGDIEDAVSWNANNSYTGNNWSSQPVRTMQPNELGFYDMSGNVWEWCADWYGPYSSEDQTNPTGPESGNERVLRGGHVQSNYTRISKRDKEKPSNRNHYLYGLRIAL